MQSRIRYLIKNIQYDGYMNRMADGLVSSMFSALWFHSLHEVETWMQGSYAPKDRENYRIVETVTFISEVDENV